MPDDATERALAAAVESVERKELTVVDSRAYEYGNGMLRVEIDVEEQEGPQVGVLRISDFS